MRRILDESDRISEQIATLSNQFHFLGKRTSLDPAEIRQLHGLLAKAFSSSELLQAKCGRCQGTMRRSLKSDRECSKCHKKGAQFTCEKEECDFHLCEEHSKEVLNQVAELQRRGASLEPTEVCKLRSLLVKAWSVNVTELKSNLEQQHELTWQLRESARIQDQQQSESFAEKYRSLLDTLKSDVRMLFGVLPEFVDVPQDSSHKTTTWDHFTSDMEMELKAVSAMNAGDSCLLNPEPLAMLLNYRDKVATLLLSGVLYEKAVLDWDLKSERAFADGSMVETTELVLNLFSKTDSVPAKLRPPSLPTAHEPGPFTHQKRKPGDKGGTELTPLQGRMQSVLREMQSLDRGLRVVHFASKVEIANKSGEQNAAVEELRGELLKWIQRCADLGKELESSKVHRHSGFEKKVEDLSSKLAEKEQTNKQFVTQIHKLESAIQSLKYELATLRRETKELADQNQRIAKESGPVLEKLNLLVSKTQQAVERLTSDSLELSASFRRQAQEIEGIREERDKLRGDIDRHQALLQQEIQKNNVKESALKEQETLYLRVMAARKFIHESQVELEQEVDKVEGRMKQMELDWQMVLQVIQGRQAEIAVLTEDLRRFGQRKEELIKQCQMCAKEFRRLMGRQMSIVLSSPAAPS